MPGLSLQISLSVSKYRQLHVYSILSNVCYSNTFISILCNFIAFSFVKLKSYIGTGSSGKITKMLGLDTDLEGRHVILIEDIVDTARTLHNFLPELQKQNPASVSILTLLVKPDAMEHDIDLKYVGFSVPNHFLVGYGLDYDGFGRELNDIYQIAE